MLSTLHTFDNYQQAHLIKSKLESEDIRCYLFDDNMMNLMPLYNVTIGGIKLKVSPSDLDAARQILEEWNVKLLSDEGGNALKCPNCGSTEILPHFISMRGLKGIFSAIVAFIFAIFPFYYKRLYHCSTCNNEFKLSA